MAIRNLLVRDDFFLIKIIKQLCRLLHEKATCAKVERAAPKLPSFADNSCDTQDFRICLDTFALANKELGCTMRRCTLEFSMLNVKCVLQKLVRKYGDIHLAYDEQMHNYCAKIEELLSECMSKPIPVVNTGLIEKVAKYMHCALGIMAKSLERAIKEHKNKSNVDQGDSAVSGNKHAVLDGASLNVSVKMNECRGV